MDIDIEPKFDLLFNPKSIALIGSSNNIEKWGAIIFLNIIFGGYQGKLFPVNNREEFVFGHKAYANVTQIPEKVDLAIIAIPARATKEAVLDCLQKGVRMAIVITSDFSETGEEGARLERELTEMARAGGMRLVGPNTMGIFSASASLTALMPPVRPKKGKVSLISQSGNIGTQMLGWGEKFAVGFNKYVSSGNEGDLKTEDYLSYLGKDPETKVILLYIEGLDNGRKFFKVAKQITPHKPIIVFKGGRTSAGARAAKSHSGAMAGKKEIYAAAFGQAGILWASTSEEMLEWAAAFTSLPLPQGPRVGILTRGGGWGVITADACQEIGLEVPPLDVPLLNNLNNFLPPYWSKGNPVDMVATISTSAYINCLEALISWEKIDAVISLSGDAGPLAMMSPDLKKRVERFSLPAGVDKILQKVSESRTLIYEHTLALIKKYNKPVFAVGTNLIKGKGSAQEDHFLAQFRTPERAVRAAGALYQYARFRQAINVKQ
ncbi:MAG: acetate--CoA ligase family protein [Thermodesulfobacteriota bacterium]